MTLLGPFYVVELNLGLHFFGPSPLGGGEPETVDGPKLGRDICAKQLRNITLRTCTGATLVTRVIVFSREYKVHTHTTHDHTRTSLLHDKNLSKYQDLT